LGKLGQGCGLASSQSVAAELPQENAEEEAWETRIPELVQVTFYAMMAAWAVEVGILLEILSDELGALEDLSGIHPNCG